jgi:hypothetical protein
MDDYMFGDMSRLYGDNVQEGHRTTPVTVPPPPEDKTDGKVALEFLSKLSVVYNDSKMSNSVRRDIVVENGTHIDFERSSVHTELEPETNRTTYYISNDTHSTVIPAPTPVSTSSSRNWTQTPHNNAALGVSTPESLDSSKQPSSHPHIAVSTHVVESNATETSGNKDSTTSESKLGRPSSRSNGARSNSSREVVTVTRNKPVTLGKWNETKSGLMGPERTNRTNDTVATSRSASKSKAGGPVSSERLANRGGRVLVSTRTNYSSTNGLEQSSQTPLPGSPETNLNSETATKKPRTKLTLRRTGSNVESSSLRVALTTSGRARGNETTPTQATRKNGTYPTSGHGVTEAPKERTTTGHSSSRGRAVTYQRPLTSANNKTSGGEANGGKVDSSTASPTTSIDVLRRRLTTVNRRLQTSTSASITLSPTNNPTTESNAIVRGLSAVAGRPLTFKTENNEGNDIASFKNDAYKPVTKGRGSVRYGNQNNETSTPPTAGAWTVVFLRRASNETGNSTRRWPPTRSRKPWSADGQGK